MSFNWYKSKYLYWHNWSMHRIFKIRWVTYQAHKSILFLNLGRVSKAIRDTGKGACMCVHPLLRQEQSNAGWRQAYLWPNYIFCRIKGDQAIKKSLKLSIGQSNAAVLISEGTELASAVRTPCHLHGDFQFIPCSFPSFPLSLFSNLLII